MLSLALIALERFHLQVVAREFLRELGVVITVLPTSSLGWANVLGLTRIPGSRCSVELRMTQYSEIVRFSLFCLFRD